MLNNKFKFHVLIFLVINAWQVFGQINSSNSKSNTVLMAKALIDVENGKVISNPIVFIKDGKIEKIEFGKVAPKDVHIINLSDQYILPGLIDSHTHLCHEYFGELDNVSGSNTIVETVMMSDGDRALLGAKNAKEMLMAGFTSARDLGNSGVDNARALRDAINKGWMTGPRLFVSTRAISPIGGQFAKVTPELHESIVSKEYIEVSNVDEARKAVRSAIYDGADCIKVIVNNGKLVLSKEELKTIVDEAKLAGIKVAAHATNGDGPALLAIEAGVNSIEHGYILSAETLNKMAEKNIFLVPTDAAGVERYQKRIQRAIKADVNIAFGSDLYYFNELKTRGQMSISSYVSYKEAGMSNEQILRSATMIPGILLAGSGKIGLIQNGYFADVIAVEENPLENIHTLENVVFVMKEGIVIKSNK